MMITDLLDEETSIEMYEWVIVPAIDQFIQEHKGAKYDTRPAV